MTSRSWVTTAALSCLLVVASPANAAPGIVRVFEAKARDKPEATAAVVKTFPEDSRLSVSEEVTDGWRRVRLPDGEVAFIRDEELRIETIAPPPTTAPPIAAAPAAVTAVAPAPILYVKDLSHLAEIVRDDGVVHPQAAALRTRRNAAIGAIVGGMAVAALLVAGSLTVYADESCSVSGGGGSGNLGNLGSSSSCSTSPSYPMFVAGIGAAGLGLVIGGLLSPGRSDLLDVINHWNERHVDHPITLENQEVVKK